MMTIEAIATTTDCMNMISKKEYTLNIVNQFAVMVNELRGKYQVLGIKRISICIEKGTQHAHQCAEWNSLNGMAGDTNN